MAVPSLAGTAFAVGDLKMRFASEGKVATYGPDNRKYYVIPGLLFDFLVPIPVGFQTPIEVHATNLDGFTSVSTTQVTLRTGEVVKVSGLATDVGLVQGDTRQPIINAEVDDPKHPTRVIAPAVRLEFLTLRGEKVPAPYVILHDANLPASGHGFLYSPPDDPAARDPNTGKLIGTQITDLTVQFRMPNGTIVPVTGDQLTFLGGKDLSVPVPQDVILGISKIVVLRRTAVQTLKDADHPSGFDIQQIASNEVLFPQTSQYTFGALPRTNEVEVIDKTLLANIKKDDGLVHTAHVGDIPQSELDAGQWVQYPDDVAHIQLSRQSPDPNNQGKTVPDNPVPRAIAVTPDGSRAYVTLANASAVAVIDTLALQEIDTIKDDDTKPGSKGINRIDLSTPLPKGFAGPPTPVHPNQITIDSLGHYAYVSDDVAAMVYVIDINPASPTFNRRVSSISFKATDAPLGLRGLALSPDNQLLYVTAPGQTVTDIGSHAGKPGHIMVVDVSNPHAVFTYNVEGFIKEIEYDHFAHPDPSTSVFNYIPIDDASSFTLNNFNPGAVGVRGQPDASQGKGGLKGSPSSTPGPTSASSSAPPSWTTRATSSSRRPSLVCPTNVA
jgi:DNA-binding beta-propeller fold protein YncE